jgi:hypothetical protein
MQEPFNTRGGTVILYATDLMIDELEMATKKKSPKKETKCGKQTKKKCPKRSCRRTHVLTSCDPTSSQTQCEQCTVSALEFGLDLLQRELRTVIEARCEAA